MHSERIKELQDKTAYPDSISVRAALSQVWHETATEDISCDNCQNNSLRLAASKGIVNTETICLGCKFNPQYQIKFVPK